MLEFLIIFAILAAVVFVVGGPLRAVAAARRSERSDERGGMRNGHMRAGVGEALHPGGHPAPVAGYPLTGDPSLSSEIAELQAARDAKYREIRDADLDHRTGKLSDADYEAVDQTLRAEALEILRALDRAAK